MRPPANENVGLSTGSAFTAASGPGGFPASPAATPSERDPHAAATDWQVIHHLKTSFERDPALISSLFEDPDRNQSAAHTATLVAAVREALAARPHSADLHYHAATAALRVGKTGAAADLLEKALEIDPCHVAASVLLSDVCMALKEPRRAVAWSRRALARGTASADASPAARRDRRGHELFT